MGYNPSGYGGACDAEDRLLDSLEVMRENREYGCEKCKHLNKGSISCKAFPIRKINGEKYGIHSDILTGLIRHDKPMFGQKNKVIFEAKKN